MLLVLHVRISNISSIQLMGMNNYKQLLNYVFNYWMILLIMCPLYFIRLIVFINLHNWTIPLQWLENFITVKPQQNDKLLRTIYCLVDYEGKSENSVHVHCSISEDYILKFLLILWAVGSELATKYIKGNILSFYLFLHNIST